MDGEALTPEMLEQWLEQWLAEPPQQQVRPLLLSRQAYEAFEAGVTCRCGAHVAGAVSVQGYAFADCPNCEEIWVLSGARWVSSHRVAAEIAARLDLV
jgi:hypothetical protein